MGLGFDSEKLIRPSYQIARALPFMNLVKTPTIVTPDAITGVLVSAELNELGLYNLELASGQIIRNIDPAINLKIPSILALMVGRGIVWCNKTLNGFEVPWGDLEKSTPDVAIMKAQRDLYRDTAKSLSEEMLDDSGSIRRMAKTERDAEALGRINQKSAGKMVFGKSDYESRMTPDMMQIYQQMNGENQP